jgi:hypothetical protein
VKGDGVEELVPHSDVGHGGSLLELGELAHQRANLVPQRFVRACQFAADLEAKFFECFAGRK